MTEQEVKTAIELDPGRVISVTGFSSTCSLFVIRLYPDSCYLTKAMKPVKGEENFEKQLELIKFVREKTDSTKQIVIDRSNGKNEIAHKLLSMLIPPLEKWKQHLTSKSSEFEDEIAHQMKFAADRESRFVGRNELIEIISWQINSELPSKRVYLFTGPSGSGKSSLLSKLAYNLCKNVSNISSYQSYQYIIYCIWYNTAV